MADPAYSGTADLPKAPWPDLTISLWQIILKHVPQHQRVGHASTCALVCSSWAEAAAAATDSIVLEQCADTASLQLWLQRHGDSLNQLHVTASSGMLTQLPCPKLTDLLLQGHSLLTAPSLPAVLAGLPSLQHLSLRQSNRSVLFQVLQQLRLHSGISAAAPSASCLLQQLPPGITHIELCGVLSGAALQELGRLTKCSHLVLQVPVDCPGELSLAVLEQLQGLTFLHVSDWEQDISSHCIVSTLPDFRVFTALQHLHLQGTWTPTTCRLQPKQLAGLRALQYLQLDALDLHGGAAGGAELLAVLPHLSRLTHLGLVGLRDLRHCPAAAFSAITASSSLQHLELGWFEFVERTDGDFHDQHHWWHIFPLNRQLPQLKTLILTCVRPCMASDDLQACVSCCSKLQELRLELVLEHDVQPHALLQLSGLTNLSAAISDADTAVLAQLTGLRELSCPCMRPARCGGHISVTAAGLQRLTALKQLTCLRFGNKEPTFRRLLGQALQQQQLLEGDHKAFVNKAPPGSPSDVCCQLLAALQSSR